jgi:hypothetical protein
MFRAARLSLQLLARCLLGATLLAASFVEGAATNGSGIPYRNEKFGFSLSVPGKLFVPGRSRNAADGGLWISRDRQARLVAVAGRNETNETLRSYRAFVIQQSYADARLDDTPVQDTWFVLSGTKGNQMFYERITFVCDGRYIYGWQIFYPARQRRIYDQIVEELERSYRPGQGESGDCG